MKNQHPLTLTSSWSCDRLSTQGEGEEKPGNKDMYDSDI